MTINFSEASYTFSESDSSASVQVVLSNEIIQSITVQVDTGNHNQLVVHL